MLRGGTNKLRMRQEGGERRVCKKEYVRYVCEEVEDEQHFLLARHDVCENKRGM